MEIVIAILATALVGAIMFIMYQQTQMNTRAKIQAKTEIGPEPEPDTVGETTDQLRAIQENFNQLEAMVATTSNQMDMLMGHLFPHCPLEHLILWERIEQLDFSGIIAQLRKTKPDWDNNRLRIAIQEYKGLLFLYGTREKGDRFTTWNPDIEPIWHMHILHDLWKYEEDCRALFGHMLYCAWAPDAARDHDLEAHVRGLYIRHFTAPKNTPAPVAQSYVANNNLAPWLLWWSLRAREHTEHVSTLKYNPTTHAFEKIEEPAS